MTMIMEERYECYFKEIWYSCVFDTINKKIEVAGYVKSSSQQKQQRIYHELYKILLWFLVCLFLLNCGDFDHFGILVYGKYEMINQALWV